MWASQERSASPGCSSGPTRAARWSAAPRRCDRARDVLAQGAARVEQGLVAAPTGLVKGAVADARAQTGRVAAEHEAVGGDAVDHAGGGLTSERALFRYTSLN